MTVSRVLRGTLALVVASTSAPATTWYVDTSGTPPGTGTQGDPYTSIQYAIDRPTTVHGDTLLLAPGTYVENVDQGKRVRIEGGDGPQATVIEAAGPGPVVLVDAPPGGGTFCELVGVTVTGARGANSRAGLP